MAQENVKKFYEQLNGDEELQKKIKSLADSYTGDKSDEKAAFEAVVAPVAKEAGYEFTYEEAVEAAKEAAEGEIPDDEAEAVAGGKAYCVGIGFGTAGKHAGAAVCDNVGFGAVFGW